MRDGLTEAEVDRILDRLAAAGLVDVAGSEVTPSRRWVARMTAAAEKLNLLAAREGRNPPGNPLVLAVTRALADENLELPDDAFDDTVRVLVMLELSRMAPHKRAQMGFPDVRFAGET